jgi:hypothetical protein
MIREFLRGQTQRVRVISGVSQGSVLGPLLFLAYIKYIWRNIELTIRLFTDDCITYIYIGKLKIIMIRKRCR